MLSIKHSQMRSLKFGSFGIAAVCLYKLSSRNTVGHFAVPLTRSITNSRTDLRKVRNVFALLRFHLLAHNEMQGL
jgi:hypothetical protein